MRVWLLLVCLLSWLPLLGCGDDGGGGDDADGSSGDGSAGEGAGGDDGATPRRFSDIEVGEASRSCLEFSPCGGDLEGEWEVDEVCFPNIEVLFEGLADGDECDDWLTEARVGAGGTRSYDADGNVEATLMLVMELEAYFSLECLRAALGPDAPVNSQTCSSWERGLTSATMGVSCVLRDDGCDCNITREDLSEGAGSYSVSGDEVDEDGQRIPYCVDGDTLTLSIERAGLVGNIVLSK